ncbi:MAG: hypothetical protein ACJ768_21100 [Gaiellaceae bacterium]
MPYVYLPVPEDRVEDVYRLLAGADEAEAKLDQKVLLERAYRESDGAFRRLLDYLAERPGEPVTTKQLAAGIGLERGTASLAGMLGAYGRRARNRYGGFWPFSKAYNPVEESNELVMADDVAEAIRQLR